MDLSLPFLSLLPSSSMLLWKQVYEHCFFFFFSILCSMGNIRRILGCYQWTLVRDSTTCLFFPFCGWYHELLPLLDIFYWLQFQTLQLSAYFDSVFFAGHGHSLSLGNWLLTDFKNAWDLEKKSFTRWGSVVPHKASALTLPFLLCLRILRHKISFWLVGNTASLTDLLVT